MRQNRAGNSWFYKSLSAEAARITGKINSKQGAADAGTLMKAIVVLPTYNEKDNIESIVRELLKIDGLGIVIVDDDSPDGTGQIADRLAREHVDRVRVIHRKERGRGTAGIAGFKYALAQQVEYILEMDADFSHDPADIPRLMETAERYDVVIGSRYIAGGKDADRGLVRQLISRIASLYTRLVLGWDIRDWTGGFKCYRKQALASLNFDCFYSQGYSIGMEILCRLRKNGHSFVEIPIVFRNRKEGRSKFSFHHVIEYFINSLRLRGERFCFWKREVRVNS
jgi:dolichol-phosphate mannosyltransferase